MVPPLGRDARRHAGPRYHAALDRGRRPVESTLLIYGSLETLSKEVPGMTLRLGDTAPDFTADSTAGPIKFHEWAGISWAILFSHPRDFTPVCTTELGYVARLKPDFERRNVKVLGLSIDPVDSHKGWVADIKETQGHEPSFPIVADPERKVANLYGMMHPPTTRSTRSARCSSSTPPRRSGS
jgi:peroxiredoxin